MLRLLLAASIISISALGAVEYLKRNKAHLNAGQTPRQTTEQKQVTKADNKPQTVKKTALRLSGVEHIARDQTGHYRSNIKLNNFNVQGLIDTGASTIAINETTARRAGIRLKPSDYIYEVSTANGSTKAARAVIRQVTLGSIRIADVEALVMKDSSLNTVLIGMSFMNKLRGFEYKSGKLVLRR
ncbi:TIGR02281 family clan AA aspartic protease [Ahrensia sp. 13_GOM-1096m]|jgi:aspartyl protease family protein|uniref:TIGR02281 family clan AA aspartic protease n=1 Tax=Ahrensia sp. 13_GOM-1096m TaxID=1380380 RepID=UPI00047CABFA|nr:TIGR02281 family clan AA aspartic protease [Ahrensia sp. 13_GOM-1096m]